MKEEHDVWKVVVKSESTAFEDGQDGGRQSWAEPVEKSRDEIDVDGSDGRGEEKRTEQRDSAGVLSKLDGDGGLSVTCHQTMLASETTPFETFHRSTPLTAGGQWPPANRGLVPPRTQRCCPRTGDAGGSSLRTQGEGRRKSFSGWLPHRRPGAKTVQRRLEAINKQHLLDHSAAAAGRNLMPVRDVTVSL